MLPLPSSTPLFPSVRRGPRLPGSALGATLSRLALPALTLLLACANNPTTSGFDAGPDASTLCSPSCVSPEVCMNGVCVDTSICVTGPECTPGDTRDLGACGNCGRQVQVCGADCLYAPSSCTAEGECAPGVEDTQTEMCTDSGDTRTRTRQCGATCAWGEYSDWVGCETTNPPDCTDGQTETREVSCTNMGQAGVQTEERSCVDGSWSTYSPTGSCVVTVTTDCTAGERRGCPSSVSSSACLEEVCSADGTWPGTCELATDAACDHISDSGVAGGRWRCCGASSWQFCLSTCQWSTECAACSGCGCS